MEDKIRSWAVVLLALMALQGCAGYPKDTPYDPNFEQGQTLFDQIPNNEGEALNRCAGHIPPSERKPHQTGRC
jgi:hypothetical protein